MAAKTHHHLVSFKGLHLRRFKTREKHQVYIWILLAALLLWRVPQAQRDVRLYTVQTENYPLQESLSFVCFGRAATIDFAGVALGKESGKAAKGEVLFSLYAKEQEYLVQQIAALCATRSKLLSEQELNAWLLQARKGDAHAKAVLSEALAVEQTPEQLNRQIDAKKESLPAPLQTVLAEYDGYFTTVCDGMEWLDSINLSTLCAEDILQREQRQTAPARGKLYLSQTWYAAAVTTRAVAEKFSTGAVYSLPNGACDTFCATLFDQRAQGERVLLLFEVYGIPKEGIPRTFSACVTYQTLAGMRVPLSLLICEGEDAYVRVYAGQAVLRRGIEITAQCGDCVFVKGKKIKTPSGQTIPALKAGECLYFENNDHQT